jgi:glucokinase
MRIVAGDIGGTKTLLQLVDDGTVAQEIRYESGAWPTFDALLSDFLARDPRPIDAACFAVAGPVIGDRAEITNLTWTMIAPDLATRFAIRSVALINDFYAVALGVPLLGAADLLSLNAGTRVPHAPIAILGAGTGLGEAALIHDGTKWNVVPSEGGHADFGPQDEEQARLYAQLHAKYGHVSWERLLSGMGLVNIHNFLTGIDRPYDETIPIDIAKLAESHDETAIRTFEIFVDIYGAEAGNMALRLLARGGVFLAGGVAAKNTRRFTDGRFARAFTRKGRFESLLRAIPVDVIVNPAVGLMGAGEMARRLLESQSSVPG